MATPLIPTMILVTSTWGDRKTFRMMPILKDCPFIEAIYDPESKMLAMITHFKKNTFHMVPRLNAKGERIPTKTVKKNGNQYEEQRVELETSQEFYVIEKAEIEDLIQKLAINSTEYDYKKYMYPEPITITQEPKKKPKKEHN